MKLGSAPASGAAADALVRRRERVSASMQPLPVSSLNTACPRSAGRVDAFKKLASQPVTATLHVHWPAATREAFWSAPLLSAPYTHLSVSIAIAGKDRLSCSGGHPACRSWRHLAAWSSAGFQPGAQIIPTSRAGVRFSAGRDARLYGRQDARRYHKLHRRFWNGLDG